MNALSRDPLALAAAAGAGAVLAAAVLLGLRRALSSADRTAGALTVLAAGIATGGSVTGMWAVFTRALGMPHAWAAAVCAFLEIAMLASALRARRALLRHGSTGADGAAVWVIAILSAVLSAAEQPGAVGRLVRLALPLVAAWLWERMLAADRRDTATEGVAWRFTPRRVAVWLRLADPVERDATDIDRSRRLARMTRQRWRVDALSADTVPRWVAVLTARHTRLAVARWRWDRQRLAAITHLGLGQEGRAVAAIRDVMEAARRLDTATAPAALEQRTATPQRPVRQPSATTSPEVAPHTATSGPPLADQPPPLEGRVVAGPVAAMSGEVADMTVADQVAWFARQLPRHPGRTVAEWSLETGLAKRTVERRIAATRHASSSDVDAAAGGDR